MNKTIACGAAIILAACTQMQADKAQSVQAQVETVCTVALPLALLYPSVGTYIVGACKSEQDIAKVAIDPAGLAWIEKVYAELRAVTGR